jgi:hypothetical protein
MPGIPLIFTNNWVHYYGRKAIYDALAAARRAIINFGKKNSSKLSR